MDAKQHAKVWRAAARVVGGMNTMAQEHLQNLAIGGAGHGMLLGRTYSEEEVVANHAYAAAARVLTAIAQEYEKENA